MSWDFQKIVDEILAEQASHVAPDQVELLRKYHEAALRQFSTRYVNRFPVATKLGMGGSGVVLKLSGPIAESETSLEVSALPKCLKYPHPCIGQKGEFSLIDVMDNEAERLREINHPNIMPLEDTFTATLGEPEISPRDRRVPSYLMPFIPSADLCEYLRRPEATAEQLVALLTQAAAAIAYLHSRKLVHLDLKPANILVDCSVVNEVRVLVSDFGFCKRIVANDNQRTLVMGTDGFMDPDLRLLMMRPTSSNDNRVRDRVPRKELKPQFDRYSFGATIMDSIHAFLDRNNADGSPRTIPTNLIRGLLFVALRCSGRNPHVMRTHERYEHRSRLAPEALFRAELGDAFAYRTSEDLVQDLECLSTNRLSFLEPEVAETTGDFVCLPERMFAPLSPRVIDALDSPLVRRLATISQLALCYHVYPGASHTRKEHVIGCYRTTCRLLRQLILEPASPIGAMILKAPQQRLAMLAALLHDASHIPLMHEFEDSIPELSQSILAVEILYGDWGGDALGREVKELLSSWQLDLDELCLVLGKRDKPHTNFRGGNQKETLRERWEKEWHRVDLQLIRSIVDGSVDADKIDYLQRDALHVGVRFGHGVDTERIETQMTTVIEVEGSGKKTLVRCRMGSWKKGQAAAESLIGVRHGMYSQVYAHRTVRAARAMLNYITWKWRTSSRYYKLSGKDIASAIFAVGSSLGPKDLRPLFNQLTTESLAAIPPKITDNLPYNETRLIRWMATESADEIAAAMAEALISRRLYKRIYSLKVEDAKGFMDIAFPSKKNVYDPTQLTDLQWLSLIDHLELQLKSFLSDGSSVGVHLETDVLPPLLIDVSIPKTMRTQSELSIVHEVLANSVTWRRITRLDGEGVIPGASVERSPMYNAFGGNRDESLAPVTIRLFAHGDLAPDLRPRVYLSLVAGWLRSFRPLEDNELRETLASIHKASAN
jgi:serine/threonine protein kinase